jgi:hypothetical protein
MSTPSRNDPFQQAVVAVDAALDDHVLRGDFNTAVNVLLFVIEHKLLQCSDHGDPVQARGLAAECVDALEECFLIPVDPTLTPPPRKLRLVRKPG